MCLNWGVHPSLCAETSNREEEISQSIKIVKKERKIADGSLAVVLGGLSSGKAGSTSIMEVKVL